MVALVRGEMLAQAVDALGQQRDLNLGGACVGRTALKLRQNPAFLLTG
jgi:hypothetical protein